MIWKPVNLSFGNRTVRAVVLNGYPMFSATDLCDILGYVNPHKILSRCCDSTPEYIRVMTAGGPQNLRMIGRGDIESLLLNYSRKTEARALWRWFRTEVFPRFESERRELAAVTLLFAAMGLICNDCIIITEKNNHKNE